MLHSSRGGGRSRLLLLALAAVLTVASAPRASASESDHKFKAGDPVKLWVNKVGPYNNPQETYNYHSLPFCLPSENPGHKWGGLGEVLGGNELIDSQLDIKFLKNVEKGSICTLELDSKKIQQFSDAIESSYWFEFFIGVWIYM
jgi:transmembrane 9 superfamily protein 3